MNAQLQTLVDAVQRRAQARRRRQPLERLQDLVSTDSWRKERFLQALSAPGTLLIGEVFRQSPQTGPLLREEQRAGTNPTRSPIPGPRWFALLDSLRQAGAVAVAVWTEEDHYGCTLEDLLTVGHAKLPRWRRDFVLDEGMLLEALNYGADAIELRPDVLDDAALATLFARTSELGAIALVRVGSVAEWERVQALGAPFVLVERSAANLELWAQLAPRIAPGSLILGGQIATKADWQLAQSLGAKAILVGEALIREKDPQALLAGWRG
jgi:indole-3-glycerol phosphate synthase